MRRCTAWQQEKKTSLDEWTSCSGEQQEYKDDLYETARQLGVEEKRRRRMAAFGLWGDAGQFTKKHNLFLLHFTMLTGIRERFPIAGFSKHLLCQCGCFGRCTFDFVFSVIAWSCEALLIGRFPKKDHNGLEFHPKRGQQAGQRLNLGGLCIRTLGDWSWYTEVLMPFHWRQGNFCARCF